MREIFLADTAATEALGAALAATLLQRSGGVLYLQGGLGAGKTTLLRALLRQLGVSGPIKSPTYTLVEPYEVNGLKLLHMDLYRLGEPEELHGLGVFDDPPCHCWWLVEWPEQGQGVLPAADLLISLSNSGGGRLARLSAQGDFRLQLPTLAGN